MSELFLALSGVSRAGKDTVADVLVERHGFVKIALADEVKRILGELFGLSAEQLWGDCKNLPDPRFDSYRYAIDARYPEATDVAERPEGLAPREMFQKTGDGWGRGLYEHVWVDYVLAGLPRLFSGGRYCPKRGFVNDPATPMAPRAKGVVLTDVRHVTDFDRLFPYAWMVRVKRDGAGLSGPLAKHASEAEQTRIADDRFDALFENKGPLEDVPQLVDAMLLSLAMSGRKRASVKNFSPRKPR